MRSGTTDGVVGGAAEQPHEIGREHDRRDGDADRDDEQEIGGPGDLQPRGARRPPRPGRAAGKIAKVMKTPSGIAASMKR